VDDRRGEDSLKKWFTHLGTETLKTLSVLAVLEIFWEVISLMRFRHYPEDKLSSLEELHFRIMYCALVVLGFNFVIKLVVGLSWSSKKT
jgi:hypothetical protein